ncbi:MAG: hypothetical protein ACYC66_15225 [Chloroflexota bacterium]
MPIMSRPMQFLAAAVYGISWVVGLLNLLAFVLNLLAGENPFGLIPAMLATFGFILLVHSRLGWFPFHGRS